MKEALRSITERLNAIDTRRRIIIIGGLAAIVLILLSESLSSCGDKKSAKSAPSQQPMTAQEYSDQLEQRLCDIIGSIEGAGDVKVMVTLQNGMEYIYAAEEKSSNNTSESRGSSGQESSDAKISSEMEYILIDTDNGEEALIRTQLMPTVNGVLIVCEGADDPQVRDRIEEAVTTALNISARRVCIIPIAK